MSTTPGAARVALIHAVHAAIAPVDAAFERLWPRAQRTHLIDAALPQDLEAAGGITPAITACIMSLAEQALAAGAQGVLFTCSAFGAAIEAAAARTRVPVLKPNEAMFKAALASGHRVGMLATYEPAVAGMAEEFHALARRAGREVQLETVLVPGALAAAMQGDIARHNQLVAEAAPRLAHCGAIMLAHFSTSTARSAVQQTLGRDVWCAPEAAVLALKNALSR
jgi:Asp/Glu/Hydantoin racemase